MTEELIFWSDKYNLGVHVIDEQHKKMIWIINKLYCSMQTYTEKEDMREIMKELVDYANYHFTTEEEYFSKFNYEGAEEHIKTHHMYHEQIEEFSKEYYENDTMLATKMMDFLRAWWTEHILGIDREYVQCFHEHGLK